MSERAGNGSGPAGGARRRRSGGVRAQSAVDRLSMPGTWIADVDLAVAAAVALVATLLAAVGAPLWLRLPLGLAAVLGAPGYALSMVAFPPGRVDAIERAALAFCLSIGAIVLVAPLVNLLPGGMTERTVVDSLAVLTLIATTGAWARRAAIRTTSGAPARVPLSTPQARAIGRRLAAGGIVLIAIGAASFAIRDGAPAAGTEFFLIGGGPAPIASDGAPAPVRVGQAVEVDLGLTNRGPAQAYRVAVLGPGGLLTELTPFMVAADASWTGRVGFRLDAPGEDVVVEIVLYRASSSTPFRTLRLRLDVVTPA